MNTGFFAWNQHLKICYMNTFITFNQTKYMNWSREISLKIWYCIWMFWLFWWKHVKNIFEFCLFSVFFLVKLQRAAINSIILTTFFVKFFRRKNCPRMSAKDFERKRKCWKVCNIPTLSDFTILGTWTETPPKVRLNLTRNTLFW